MRRAAAATVLAIFVVLLVFTGLPFLDAKREAIDATPTLLPTAELAPIAVHPGQQACVNDVTFSPQSRYVLVEVRSNGRPSPPIVVRASAPGYVAVGRHPGGIADNGPVVTPIRPPARAVGGGTVCLRNAGRITVEFFGVPPNTREASPSTTTVDGTPVAADLGVTLLASPNASIGSRLGDIFDHVAAFRPVTGWEVWILALLVVLGVPGGIAFALWRSTGAAPRDE